MLHRIDINKLQDSSKKHFKDVYLIHRPSSKFTEHPSHFFRRRCMQIFEGMSVEEIADKIGVSSEFLNSFLNEKDSISPAFAKLLHSSTGFDRMTWLTLQENYDSYIRFSNNRDTMQKI